MNKGNLNKLVTNYPVELTEEEIANLSGTLAPVIAACGGGGGGTGGKIYTGIGFVSVNNSTNQIGLTEAANTKLNQDIPTKVSDLTDSANYQTIAGMDEYLTEAEAQATYLSQSDAESYYAPIGTYTEVQTLKNQIQNVYTKSETSASDELSAEFDGLSAKYQAKGNYATQQSVQTLTLQVQNKQDKLTFGYNENNAISSINDSALAGQGGTTYSAGNGISIASDTISISADYIQAITSVSSIKGTILTGDTNIRTTSAEEGNNIKWTLELTAQPTVTDTTLSGYGGIVATKDSSVTSQWNVGIAQAYKEEIEAVSSKLTKESADTLYAPISVTGDVDTLKSSSAGWNEVSAKLGTAQYASDSATFVTSSNLTITGTKQYALTTAGWAEVQAGTSFTGVVTGVGLSGTGLSNSPLGIDTGAAINLSNASAKSAISAASAASAYNAQMFTYGNQEVAISTYAELAELAIDSLHSTEPGYREEELDEPPLIAEYAASAYLGPNTYLGFDKFVTSSTIAGTAQYAMTTAGWTAVTIPDTLSAGSGVEIVSNGINALLGTDLAFNATTSAIQINTNGTADGNLAFVEGDSTSATSTAHAEGYHTTALNNAHAEGNSTYASGYGAHAEGFHTSAMGLGVHAEGAYTQFFADGNYDGRGVAVEGYANATTAQTTAHNGILKVIGNGNAGSTGTTPSDAYILYRDGTVKAKDFIAGGDTLSANYPVPKSVPNTADNNLQVQRMFVCTSDADIVAHAAFANGEGCIFFRVG